MTLDEYPREQQRTANASMPREKRLEVAGLGMIGEAGEYADIVKKHLGQGHPLDAHKLAHEAWDCAWYALEALSTMGLLFDGNSMRQLRAEAEHTRAIPADAARVMARLASEYNDRVHSDQWDAAKYASALLVAAFAAVYASGVDFDEALEAHVAKLRARYPLGFEVERSINRPAGNGG